MIILYANNFYLVYPSEKEVQFAKRQYARQIGKFNQEQVDNMLKHLASLLISYERENKIFKEPNLPAILALLESAFKRDRSHRLFLPAPPESDNEKRQRIEKGLQCTQSLLSMFDEPRTDSEIDLNKKLDDIKLERIKNE